MQRHDRCRGVWLSGADRKRLAAALETAREARVYRRVEALLLVAQGQTVAEAARRCHVDRSSVHRWLRQYSAGRDATALADRPRSGRPRQSSRLTPRRLAAVLARDPRHCGYQATSWTVPLLAHYLAMREGIAISARTLRRRLHGLDHWSKRLSLEAAALCLCRPSSASGPEKGALVRRLKAGWQVGDVLLCMDWTLLRLFPPLRATWALVGAQAFADHRHQCQTGAIRCHRPADRTPRRADPPSCRAGRRAGVPRRAAPALPPRRPDLAVGRSRERPYRPADPGGCRSAAHSVPVAAQAGTRTEPNGSALARAQEAHRSQSAG